MTRAGSGTRHPARACDPLGHANPAKSIGILDQTGTLEAGKMATSRLEQARTFSVYALADLVVRGRCAPVSIAHIRRRTAFGLSAMRRAALFIAALLLAAFADAEELLIRSARGHGGRRRHARKRRRTGA